MTDPDQNADTLDLIPLQDLSASVSVLSKRKKRTRQESVEWNTVRITKENPNNPSWECIHCGKSGYGGVTLVRSHILNKCNPFPPMKVHHGEVVQIIQAAIKSSVEESISTRDRFNAAQRANFGHTTLENWTNKEIKESTDSAVSNWIFEDNKPLMSASTPAFVELCEMVSRYTLVTKSIYKPPSRDKIKGTLMRKATDNMEVELRRLEVVAHKYGTTLVSDGWKNCKRQPIINLLLITSEGTVFIDCIDTKGQKKDAEYIVKFIETGVKERIPPCLQGTESLVVMDGACKRALTFLEQRSTNLIAVPCACHALDLMLEKLFGQSGKTTLKQQEWVYNVVQRLEFIAGFVLNHEFSLGLYRKYSENGVKKELLKAADTRFASKFLLICRAVDVHNNLERMVVDPEWNNRLVEQTPKVKHDGMKVKREIQATSLWTCARNLIELFSPLHLVLRLADQGGPAMATLDGEMRRARELMVSFKTNNYVSELRLRNCVKLFDVRWEWFRRPIHRVGYLLNPYYAHKSERPEYTEQDSEALTSILARFLLDVNDQAKALSQFNFFRELGGAFGSLLAQAAIHTMPPHEWFGTFGAGFRPFSTIAMKVLNMRVDQSQAERSFKRQGDIHTKKRNRLTFDNVRSLLWLSSNLALKRRWFKEAVQGANEDQQQQQLKSTFGFICIDEKADEPELENSDLETETSSSDGDSAESTGPIDLESDTDVSLEFLV